DRPALVAMMWARGSNSSVTTATAVLPASAATTVSWTVQAVHDPQLPSPTTARSTSVANDWSSATVVSAPSPTRAPAHHVRTSAPSAVTALLHSSMTHRNE